MKIRDTRRLGLVEVEVDDAKNQVVLTMHPPGGEPVTVEMGPDAAIDLSRGIAEGAHQAAGAPVPGGICLWCGQALGGELPHV